MNFRTKRFLLNTLSTVIVLMTVLFGFFGLVCTSFHIVYSEKYVEGYSMLPTLNQNVFDSLKAEGTHTQGDYIFVNNFAEIKRNDIVVANVPWHPTAPIIKRVVGLPGDIVEMKDEGDVYNLYVNDELFYSKKKTNVALDGSTGGTDSYFFKYKGFLANYPHNTTTKEDGVTKVIKVNANEYLLMGDNWGGTDDSISHGVTLSHEIAGRVDLVVPYGESKQAGIIQFMLKALFN